MTIFTQFQFVRYRLHKRFRLCIPNSSNTSCKQQQKLLINVFYPTFVSLKSLDLPQLTETQPRHEPPQFSPGIIPPKKCTKQTERSKKILE